MKAEKTWVLLLVVVAALPLAVACQVSREPSAADRKPWPGQPGAHGSLEPQVMEAMSPGHAHAGLHFNWTSLRPPNPEDTRRAQQILQTLRRALEKYQDYRVAIEDGYRPFLPNLPLPEYHFTNYWQSFLAAFRFDPAKPSSLLYRKTRDGYELVGAMYTASRFADEDDLNERIPLSVARWHAHVNICLPPRGQGARADWTQFGPRGSIATEEACEEAGGRWYPQIFGWMVHVYPFADTPEEIWTHR